MQSPAKLSRSVLIWAALAALALVLFVGMSLLALANGAGAWLSGVTPTPTLTPTLTPAISGDAPTPDEEVAGAAETATTPQPEATAALPLATPSDPAAMLGLWLSAVSAITALIGLASSLWLGWRKEGREMAQHHLELEKARLEIRKLRQELDAAGDNG